MLTRLTIRNLKRFSEVAVDLSDRVVFIGPNDSGKTTALQALALWSIGLGRWVEKRGGRPAPSSRPGITLNRRDLVSIPIPDANHLWRQLHVRDVKRVGGKPQTSNVRIDIIVEGVTAGVSWKCGLEFDYANPESLYCRPLRLGNGEQLTRMPIPDEALDVNVAFLPPMSGLAATEQRLDVGAINVLLGEGRTAEVLRNLCYQITDGPDGRARWTNLASRIQSLFGIDLDEPRYITERGEIALTYTTHGERVRLDISAAVEGCSRHSCCSRT